MIDVKKAHLHATVGRDIFVELPPELNRPGMCARLKRCLYGTRDAPARWEAFLADKLQSMGFVKGRASPCCYHHPDRDLRCMVHGDDFVFVGPDPDLDWAQAKMQQEFLVKVVGRLGGDAQDQKEISILNRIVSWTADGLLYEADPRHAELLARDLAGSGPQVGTPGVKTSSASGGAEGSKELSERDARWFRAGAARANYLALDRPELAFASKELCRRMSSPHQHDVAPLIRVARYLAGAPRLQYKFQWQTGGLLRTCVDTDFAGCLATRRSTSGGCSMHGKHLIKHWSSTQHVLTLSSGEAELTGIVKGVTEAMGMMSVARDLGISLQSHVYADSAAAIGICRRTGIGRVRHLAVAQLWVQERLRMGDFVLHKLPGAYNPADLMTKHLQRELADRHLQGMSIVRVGGRAALAPHMVTQGGN